ncbi:Maf family protein [Falsirhodobacter deserti]|uniref:Maf family protein n=1 Tax=Falsirhodobacter deserti TaxID=1365611 RepID=UPI000FE3B928|nr:Maf family nucleotide pyrophosphatase [Falsirhodobacter deserti]
MSHRLILATSSDSRRRIVASAGVQAEALPARIDEEAIRLALEAEAAKPRDIADTLAEMKARKIAERHPDSIVIGSDQVLCFENRVHGKPDSLDSARRMLQQMRGKTHQLISAVVVYEGARPVWRHVDQASLTMRTFSDDWLEGYLQRNHDVVCTSAGGYRLEEEGVRLFSDIKGDWFTIMGLPLLPLLVWLTQRGFIDG